MNDDKQRAAIARNVKRLRDARGWSQDQLARRAGLEVGSWISQIERHKRTPETGTLAKLAKALGVKMEQLLKE